MVCSICGANFAAGDVSCPVCGNDGAVLERYPGHLPSNPHSISSISGRSLVSNGRKPLPAAEFRFEFRKGNQMEREQEFWWIGTKELLAGTLTYFCYKIALRAAFGVFGFDTMLMVCLGICFLVVGGFLVFMIAARNI